MSYNGKVFVLNFDILGFLQSTIAQGNPIFSGWVDHIFTYAYIHTFLYREVIVKYSEGLPLAKEKWMDASPWLSIWMKIHKEMLFTDFRSSEILASDCPRSFLFFDHQFLFNKADFWIEFDFEEI